jgi:hypothetical protein
VGLVPILGLLAAMLSGIWIVFVSLFLFARARALDHPWDEARQVGSPQADS